MSIAGSYPQNRPVVMDIIEEVNPSSIIDIGLGTGFYGEIIRKKYPNIRMDGVEPFDYSNQRWQAYDNIFRSDIRHTEVGKYDLYLLVDIVEHMSKEEAHAVIAKLDGPVVVSTPPNYPQAGDENPLQEHVSNWSLEDFSRYRYKNYTNPWSIIVLIEREV